MPGNMTFDELQAATKAGTVDTVVVAFADMQGRVLRWRWL
jgi:hypothetical protein